jgi:hypothetical protein
MEIGFWVKYLVEVGVDKVYYAAPQRAETSVRERKAILPHPKAILWLQKKVQVDKRSHALAV